MNESSNEKNKNLIMTSNETNETDKSKTNLSTTDDQIKKCHSLNKYFVNHKNISSFKLKLIKDIHYIEKHIKIFGFLKFLLGFILLAIPLFIIIYFIFSDYTVLNKYLFL